MPVAAPVAQAAAPVPRAVAAASAATVPAAAPAVEAPPRPKPKPVPDAKPAEQSAAAPATPKPAPVAKAAASQAAPAAVPLLSELPENIRLLIPPLAITGVVYSDNPAQRLLLVNRQVLPQGSLTAPEVTLEEIQARSSVFSFRGTRFRVAH